MSYLLAFVVGGLLCTLAQLVLDLTPPRFTQGHVMVLFVVLGAVAGGLGLYRPLVELAGAGATIPLPGFGFALVEGALQGASRGLGGILAGGLGATALGLTVAILGGLLTALLFNPKG
ncbi:MULTISPECIES: SpoVA/SpoVAEb family sporulation membrane protein [Thermaerobacter]|uniref:SpoVA/SpoVAEb family sporulation membrane protein n=1 Tax=Thermaerobacter composti TaxID=554949 RepID=A0ABZ0QRJ6_9FIRM|nr:MULTISPECIES: SpoVA/SpoVAEb family sporulation membrane protein [Thermaerobacter]PZN07187.1 MAG: stage V sporulation protein AE [Bacillota bacterium]QBS37944.1 SpoVA/SpoVAEb family sporulation membrane protein [Thermaerobacter sp. FW80]WPD20111.1 SpoVA/SpoVAEb family sporulation membrane protein [Thermaerobacter composti]